MAQGLWLDLKLAARRLAAAPLFAIFAMLSLAAGVAVTTAIYSIVDDIFLRDAGVRDPAAVAFVVAPFEGRVLTGSLSEADFRDLRAAQRSFSRLSAFEPLLAPVSSPFATELLPVEAVDAGYFQVLGVTPALGRTITGADAERAAQVVVLSHALWRQRFASNARVVGTTIGVGGHRFEVVGVAAPAFGGATGLLAGGPRLWIVREARAQVLGMLAPPAPSDRRLVVFGRLGPGVTEAAASAEMSAVGAALDAADRPGGPARRGRTEKRVWRAKSLEALSREDGTLRRTGMTLVGLVGLVLFVACTNLANLVLARGITRQRELAVRRALGASRWRLVREQCMESLLLAAGGAAAGYVTFEVLCMLLETSFDLTLPNGPRWTLEVRPSLDGSALAVASISMIASLVVFGLEPALQLTRSRDVRQALAAGAGLGVPRAGRQRALLRWQVAVSAGFFLVATMFVRYTIEEARHDSGVAIDRVAVASLNVRAQGWDDTRISRTIGRVLEEGGRQRSFEAIAVSAGLPFGAPAPRVFLSLPGEPLDEGGRHRAAAIGATPSIFRTLGVPILRGRAFDERDAALAPRVAVLSELTARRMFDTIDVIGRELLVHGGAMSPHRVVVVGVARNTDVGQVLQSGSLVYLPLSQHGNPGSTVIVRGARGGAGAGEAVSALRETLRRADPDLAVDAIGTGRSMLTGPFVFVRAAGFGALALGAVTLMLAMAGLFGIQSHLVARRSREIGLRMACGATAAQIRRMVFKDGSGPVLQGLGLGLFIGLAGRAIVRAAMELDISVVDLSVVAIVPIPLVLAAYCACYLPARRAAGVDPNIALRQE